MDEDVANKLAYGGITIGSNAPGLAVELGGDGDGDVSDFGHGLFSSAGGIRLPAVQDNCAWTREIFGKEGRK